MHLMVFVLLAGVTASAGNQPTPAREPQLRVLVPGGQAGGLTAFQWEVLSGFARAERMQIQRVELPSLAAAPQALASRTGDVAGARFASILGNLAWSDEVVPSRFVVVSRRPGARFGFVEDLRGKKLGADGRAAAEALSEVKLSAAAKASATEALAALKAGQLDAVVVDLYDALGAQQKDPALQLGAFVGQRHPIGFALRRGDPRLTALNRYLAQLRASSSFGALLGRHLGPDGLQALGRAKLSER